MEKKINYGDATTFSESLEIQFRVIHALMMREIITRYGRQNIGFLWLFAEPMMMTLMIVFLWGSIRADRVSSLNIYAFMITGWPMMMMWRHAASKAMSAISANQALLYHKNVKVLDTIITRVLLEIAGATGAQILMMGLLIYLGLIPFPYDTFYMLCAWFLMAIFGFGLGLIVCSLAQKYEMFSKFWGMFNFILMPLSGAFMFVSALPPNIQKYALYIPMMHGTEMFRHGYFGNSVVTMENVPYLIFWDLVLLLFGLSAVRNFASRMNV